MEPLSCRCVDLLGIMLAVASSWKNKNLNLAPETGSDGLKVFQNLLMLLWLHCQWQQYIVFHTLLKCPGKGKM